ncbi:hypothetical protein F2P81_020361 [Scophthalmus maximus]|uniref:Uncharacterized protein n=1 Tax=Scophthalmus maximus TaxID=52904 RepID=A0A6A4S7T4_SCOMX|nr:hypothetical protein F2P81_020361 [Scophthalmus maximus]
MVESGRRQLLRIYQSRRDEQGIEVDEEVFPELATTKDVGFVIYTIDEWDSDMASLLVLLHLLTPQPAGRKRPKKISVLKATKVAEVLPEPGGLPLDHRRKPPAISSGQRHFIKQVSSFYIVLDRKLLLCLSCTSFGAFDEHFKSHFVFGVNYDDALSSLYTFLQTTLYNIDIGTTDETPKVKELRAKLLNKL